MLRRLMHRVWVVLCCGSDEVQEIQEGGLDSDMEV